MAGLPDDLRRLIGVKTDEVATEIDNLVGQLDLTPEQEDFAREQTGQVFDLLSNSFVDAYPRVQRARAAGSDGGCRSRVP